MVRPGTTKSVLTVVGMVGAVAAAIYPIIIMPMMDSSDWGEFLRQPSTVSRVDGETSADLFLFKHSLCCCPLLADCCVLHSGLWVYILT